MVVQEHKGWARIVSWLTSFLSRKRLVAISKERYADLMYYGNSALSKLEPQKEEIKKTNAKIPTTSVFPAKTKNGIKAVRHTTEDFQCPKTSTISEKFTEPARARYRRRKGKKK